MSLASLPIVIVVGAREIFALIKIFFRVFIRQYPKTRLERLFIETVLAMAIPPNDQLRAALGDGGEAASEEFGQHALTWLMQVARRAGIPAQDCEDVAQEALVAALGQLRRGLFRGDSSLDTWLTYIVRGKIADYWRARGQASVSLTPIAEEDLESVAMALSQIVDCDFSLLVGVHGALRELPRMHRVILLLNRTAGYTIEEISRNSGLTPGQVSARLYAAEEMFRRLLDGEAATVVLARRRLGVGGTIAKGESFG